MALDINEHFLLSPVVSSFKTSSRHIPYMPLATDTKLLSLNFKQIKIMTIFFELWLNFWEDALFSRNYEKQKELLASVWLLWYQNFRADWHRSKTSEQKCNNVLEVVERCLYIDIRVWVRLFSLFLDNLFTSEAGSFLFLLLFCHTACPLYI